MHIHIALIGIPEEKLPSIVSAFKDEASFESTLLPVSNDDALAQKKLEISDFNIIYTSASDELATTLPLSNVEIAEKSICLFKAECRQSRLLDRLGFGIVFEPCSPSDLVDEIKERLALQLRLNSDNESETINEKALVFSSTDRYVIIEKEKLIHATSSGNYTTLHLDDQRDITVTKQLGKVVLRLPTKDFFRVHHSHVVNRSYILTILKQTQLMVVLHNNVSVPVSRRRKKEFLTWLGLYS